MKRFIEFSMLLILALMLASCKNATNNIGETNNLMPSNDVTENEKINKQDKLLLYMDYELAEDLLLETWTPFKELMEKENNELTLSELILANKKMHPSYLEIVYNMILYGEGKDSIKFKKKNFIPIISNEEAEITNIELEENFDSKVGYLLIITEYGEFRDIKYVLDRQSAYFVDEDGEIRLYSTRGSLGKIYINRPSQ